MAGESYFSFEDVLGELQLDEEELKRMVSEGELRAFRDENKMKFRRDDVENLKKGKVTEPTVVLPSEGGGDVDDTTDTVLDFADEALGPDETAVPDLDLGATEDTETVTAPPEVGEAGEESGDTTGITEEMIFDESDLTVDTAEDTAAAAEETFVDEDEMGLTTEPLEFADEGDETAEETIVEEGVEEEYEEGVAAPPRRGRLAAAQAAPVYAAPATEGIGWKIILVLAAGLLLAVGCFMIDGLRMGTEGQEEKPLDITQSLSDSIAGGMLGHKFEETEPTPFKVPELE